jgi:hypothetical protein
MITHVLRNTRLTFYYVMLYPYLEKILAIKAIITIIAITIIIPTQRPVLKTSPINSHPGNDNKDNKKLKGINKFFIFFSFN